ncbi:hypothetical protein [Pediococcus pentosaceus]|uniref:hypothetical protein n=1 Tax=Pediococcus pentosaceus TaxID=1255 RepID=UPI003981DEDD
MIKAGELRKIALAALKEKSAAKLEQRMKDAASQAFFEVTFNWDKEEDRMLANFVDLFKEDKEVFGEGYEIKSDAQGITVSFANAVEED